jgi:hypothetical protein
VVFRSEAGAKQASFSIPRGKGAPTLLERELVTTTPWKGSNYDPVERELVTTLLEKAAQNERTTVFVAVVRRACFPVSMWSGRRQSAKFPVDPAIAGFGSEQAAHIRFRATVKMRRMSSCGQFRGAVTACASPFRCVTSCATTVE